MTMKVVSTPKVPPSSAFGAISRARVSAASGLKLLLGWQFARMVLRLSFAAATALLVGRLVMGGEVETSLLIALPALLVAATLAGLISDRIQMRTEITVSANLRGGAAEMLQSMSGRALQSIPTGTLTMSMQRHPAAIAALVTSHRAATLMMAIGPLVTAAALICVSWQAVLLLLCLTPVMIIFFVLVGDTIRTRADAQERAFSRLAGQFADRIRTLPTILANHGLAAEEAKLAERLQVYASNMMTVLRVAFLNSAVIDFFASLSIAMLAVFLGLGHLKLAMIPGFSNLELWQTLFILMIAPEYFAPFRRFSEQYHAKADGLAAAAALNRLLITETPELPRLHAVDHVMAGIDFPESGLVVIVGPSGSGKSTLLRRVAGIEPATSTENRSLAGSKLAWISSDCYVSGETLTDAILWNSDSISPTMLRDAAERVDLLDNEMLPGGLEAPLAAGGANLSGGQRMRVAIARAMLGHRVIIADEPTAKLDYRTAAVIRKALRDLAGTRLVLVATHDRELIALADRLFDLSPVAAMEAA
ncbi:ATP-binding cassette domain-containing protein [Mesorhizobium sp. SB112]|uniref:ATP-binding cassette domain-containing protein n=1 Tax=Mesorhizobium sp. SB112 TaxID=3151853 RepID=UPI003263A874